MGKNVPEPLVFGTDGWRDLIAERFTFGNVARAAQAYADTLLARGGRSVLVGYDTRFLGPEFAMAAARVLAANGLEVRLSRTFLPTPALSFAVRHCGADGGVMLTASHNPYGWQGFKLKGSYGGSATGELYGEVARRVAAIAPEDVRSGGGEVGTFDIQDAYFTWLNGLLDMRALEKASGMVIHDAMGGAAAGWLAGWVRQTRIPVTLVEFRDRPDPYFYGVNPEPIGENLQEAMEVAWENGPLFLAATDGDGDRLGVVLPDGSFFNSHQIFAVLLRHLHSRGGRGRVIKTVTVSRIVERLAAKLGLPVTETPVGFKHIAEEMLKGDVLIGGEESGGIGTAGHIPERDGILNTLLLLEAVAVSGRSLAEQFSDIERETGWRHAYGRRDLVLRRAEELDAVFTALAETPQAFAGRRVTGAERLDGVKLNLEGGAWLLFRSSGTEPVLRVYCEAQAPAEVDALLGEAVIWTAVAGEAAPA